MNQSWRAFFSDACASWQPYWELTVQRYQHFVSQSFEPWWKLQLKVKQSNKHPCVFVLQSGEPPCFSPPSHLSTLPGLQFSSHSSAEKAADLHNVTCSGGDCGAGNLWHCEKNMQTNRVFLPLSKGTYLCLSLFSDSHHLSWSTLFCCVRLSHISAEPR